MTIEYKIIYADPKQGVAEEVVSVEARNINHGFMVAAGLFYGQEIARIEFWQVKS